ncbi:hypothetical protein ASE75_02540 [Sphingomonas sp. Leaf17]|uniref:polysaccharide biosynthesis/export family protein n=1 Tax=Sphingomonas sp. Leaf17 TaxID=1735683 RepID=UPI0006F26364|nr:polysaccharide biosynthesis/export family protein [Sphingomonas sp. Leaf17]KQM67799.1 hypothetical protein ASE75_02540 [Sphingomonas sp. Leaf17]
MKLLSSTGNRVAICLVVSAAGIVSGCSSLPTSGPTARQIIANEKDEAARIGFQIVNLDATTLPQAGATDAMSSAGIAALARNGRVDQVGPGDVLSITIYEVGVTLFGSGTTTLGGTAGSGAAGGGYDPSAKAQNLAGVTVRDDGTIRLPFIGNLRVAGRTTAEIEAMIVAKLRGMSQAPQALVTISGNMTNTILVSGAVTRPGRQQLSLVRERLLDAIAAAGGTGERDGPQSTVVRFTRDGQSAEAYLGTIAPGSAADLTLLPGDRIDLIRRPRSFSVFGAAGKVMQLPIDANVLSLAEAVAQAGGPDDSRADPTAVFVFRDSANGLAAAPGARPAAPMVYRLDLMKPSSYFVAQRFAMRDKDVIYVANARLNQTRKLVEIFNVLFTPVFTLRQTVQ